MYDANGIRLYSVTAVKSSYQPQELCLIHVKYLYVNDWLLS